jgi:processive 1,2-diacylglycerol beta-glucosyltransferase
MGKKKILILYSTAGMGHKKAASALFEALKKSACPPEVEIRDVMEYSNGLYRFLYLRLYVLLMSRAKWLWGKLYNFSNSLLWERVTGPLRGIIDYFSLPGLGRDILEKRPDAVVATHFLLPSIARRLRKIGVNSRLYAVITDYGPHLWWLSGALDGYFVGSESVKNALETLQVPPERVTVSGIPVSGDLIAVKDTASVRKDYGLAPDRKTVLIMSGGFGVGPIKQILLSLNKCNSDIQVIAVCGHNRRVKEDIAKIEGRLAYPARILGFTDRVPELMSVADVMISKAGGISVTEALNARLPLILYGSIPGQETWNEQLLVKEGAAEKSPDIASIPSITDRVLISEDVYGSLLHNIDRIRRPDAASVVAEKIIDDTG